MFTGPAHVHHSDASSDASTADASTADPGTCPHATDPANSSAHLQPMRLKLQGLVLD
jgi:hypothetical protein